MSERTGFRVYSLVELVLIIVILGVVAALTVPRLSSAAPTPESALEAPLRTLESQLGLFHVRHGRYPSHEELARAPLETHRGDSFGILIDRGYLLAAPVNPVTGGARIDRDWRYDPATGRIEPVTADRF